MDSLLTLVVLSALPIPTPSLHIGCTWLNHVSTFHDAAGLHSARLQALGRVTTPAFIFVDDSDKFLGQPSLPAGLHLGDEIIDSPSTSQLQVVSAAPYDAQSHISSPTLVHRAICNTAAAKKVAEYLPIGDYYTEWLLYYFIAAWRGAVLQPGSLYLWKKELGGMHTKVQQAIMNTQLWLMQNHKRVLKALQAIPA
jgi:hypothetical protein